MRAQPAPAASRPSIEALKYQTATKQAGESPELLTVKLRYKEPEGETSKMLERSFVDGGTAFAQAAPDLKFAAAVAEFGMLLRDSEFKGNGTLGAVVQWGEEGKGMDSNSYRRGFLSLVRKAQELKARM